MCGGHLREHVGEQAGDQAIEEDGLGERESEPLDACDLVAHLRLTGDRLDHLAEDDPDADAGTDGTQSGEEDRQAWRGRGIEPTFSVYVAEALLAAVREAPRLNAAFDDEARGIRRHAAVHLGMSLANTAAAGARHGVIRDADTRNALGLAVEMQAIRSSGSTGPDVLAEATLCLADYGPGSALFAVPLVLSGQVAAVRAGAVEERLLVREHGFALAPTVYLCASIDHRALDGMDAGALLGVMKRVLEAA